MELKRQKRHLKHRFALVLSAVALSLLFCARAADNRDQKQGDDLDVSKSPVVYPTPATSNGSSVCTPKDIRFLGLGGEPSWSPSGDLIAFQRKDTEGIYQIYTIQPDGSDEKCLTCAQDEGGPSLDRHKGFAAWHPSGEYIVLQAEAEDHTALKRLTEPGRGLSNDLWVLSYPDLRWSRLMKYPASQPTAILNPRFSHDGSKLVWAEKIDRTTLDRPLGQWRMNVADFVVSGEEPRLENMSHYTPGDGFFYEAHGFSADDSRILFTADISAPGAFIFNIFTLDLASQELRNLTDSEDEWNEHATFSPHGSKVSFMSSRCCPSYDPEKFNIFNLDILRAEAYILDIGSLEMSQVTHFNTPDFPEYTSEASVATVSSWRADGAQLAVTQMLVGDSFDTVEGRRLWIITFQDTCG